MEEKKGITIAAYLRSQNVTLEAGSYSKYPPYAFTEQGIYMLMTVLKGRLAVEQSKTLISVRRPCSICCIQNPRSR